MSLQDGLTALTTELQSEIIEMDTFLKSLRPLKFKRTADKRKINYVSPGYGVSYAILPSVSRPSQHFGWYYLYDKERKTWYRKPDYFIETLTEIARNDPQAAEGIFNAIHACTSCKGNPCSAISYKYGGEEKLACYGRIILGVGHDDFNCAKAFFGRLSSILEQKT